MICRDQGASQHQRRELPVDCEQLCENGSERMVEIRNATTPGTVQTIDRQNSTREQKQEHIFEPGHYFGISR